MSEEEIMPIFRALSKSPNRKIYKRNTLFVTPSFMEKAVTVVQLEILTGEEMNEMVKDIKVLNS